MNDLAEAKKVDHFPENKTANLAINEEHENKERGTKEVPRCHVWEP